jgi:hypothetical protein
MSATGETVLSRLRPFLVEERRGTAWPGTLLLSGEATIFQFNICDSVIEIIISAADGLYDWRQPSLPEDLALLRLDGTTVLGSIAHERDAFLELTDAEFSALVPAVPKLPEIAILRRD